MSVFQFVLFGLEKGSYIAIATIGFSLIYGIVDMINFAYAEYMTLGGYAAVLLIGNLGLNVWLAITGVFVVTAILGWAVSRIAFTPIHDTGPIPLLLMSVGLGFVLRNLYRLSFGLERRFLTLKFVVLPNRSFQVDLGPLNFFVTTDMLFVIGTAVAVFVVLHVLLTRTELGIAMRATSSNEALAQLSGIRSYRIRQYTWVMASGLAGIAGLLFGGVTEVSPIMGLDLILVVLAAAILGGVGSIYGAFVGSYLIGLTVAFASVGFQPLLDPIPVVGEVLIPVGASISSIPNSIAFVLLILVLLVKPSGIAGTEVET